MRTPAPRLPFTITAVFASILLAGCSGAGRTMSVDDPETAPVDFEGTGNGFLTTYASCDEAASLVGSGTVDGGRLTIRVTDADGAELLIRSFGENFTLDRTGLTGHPGEWKIDTERSGDDLGEDEFTGTYDFDLAC